MIENLPKGALPDPIDPRDYDAEPVLAASPAADFQAGLILPEPPNSDQGTGDCCVGESSTYYHWQLKRKDYSVRSVFAHIALSYGAYIRDGVKRIVEFGQETQEEAPDPKPKTAQNMRDKTGLDDHEAIDDKEKDYFVITSNTIESVAKAVRDYDGVVFGVTGSDEGWQDLENPRPPKAGETTWGHALYAMGFHIHDGQKCIIAKSSWCRPGVPTQHHIKENYFTSGNTFNAWTLLPKTLTTKPMYKKIVHQDGKTFGVLIITPNGSQIINATSEEVWRSFSRVDSYQLNTINSDGTSNFSIDDCIKLSW